MRYYCPRCGESQSSLTYFLFMMPCQRCGTIGEKFIDEETYKNPKVQARIAKFKPQGQEPHTR